MYHFDVSTAIFHTAHHRECVQCFSIAADVHRKLVSLAEVYRKQVAGIHRKLALSICTTSS